MNKWDGIVTVLLVLIVGFIFVAFFLPSVLLEFTGYIVEVVAAVFGLTAVVIVINFFSGSGSRRGRR